MKYKIIGQNAGWHNDHFLKPTAKPIPDNENCRKVQQQKNYKNVTSFAPDYQTPDLIASQKEDEL